MHLKGRLQAGDAVYGVFCSIPAALSVELIAAAGYDFVVIDLEHTLIGPSQLAAMLLAARASNIAALVRVASPHQVLQVLDAGAEGIVFPRIRTAQAARDAVSFCHSPPWDSAVLTPPGIAGTVATTWRDLRIWQESKPWWW